MIGLVRPPPPPRDPVSLKDPEQAKRYTTVAVCRSCFLSHTGWHDKPLIPFPSEEHCSVKKCENPSSYMVALDRYDFRS